MKKNIAHRGHLKNLVKKGLIEVSCLFSYTDDYAFDTANDYGRSEWEDAVFIEDGDSYNSNTGGQPFKAWDFGTSSGYLSKREGNTYSFSIHSNLVYTVRLKESAA